MLKGLPINQIICSDVITVLKTFPDQCIDCVVTSPPYWGLRDYGVTGQLGLENTPELYVEKMIMVFREVRRVLKDKGTVWINVGDSYAGSWGSMSHDPKRKAQRCGSNERPPTSYISGNLKPKDLVGIPWMLAFALRDDGWYLRQDIIWHKPNPMPESVKDRCTKSHEHIFMLTKSKKYFYDNEAIAEPCKESNAARPRMGQGSNTQYNQKRSKMQIPSNWDCDPGAHGRYHRKGRTSGKHSSQDKQSSGYRMVENIEKKRADGNQHDLEFGETSNKRDVWTVPTMPFPEAHFAVFPTELIKPCILAGCPENGIVLDPFMGSGTTAVVAYQHRRQYVGIELNPEYVTIANKRIENEMSKYALLEA